MRSQVITAKATLKLERTKRYSETSVHIYQSTWRHIVGNSNLLFYRKPHVLKQRRIPSDFNIFTESFVDHMLLILRRVSGFIAPSSGHFI